MGLNSNKGVAQAQFNKAAQKTSNQVQSKAAQPRVQQKPANTLGMNGPKPPAWVKKAVDSKLHQQQLKTLHAKLKTKNEFNKSAAKTVHKASARPKDSFNRAAPRQK